LSTFPRSSRLTTPADFRRVFADSKRAGDKFCTLLARPSGLPQARLGLAIAKRRVRRGVDRNRIKRLVRESFRHHQQEIAGLDVVVMARDAAADADARSLRASLDRQWQRLAKRCANWQPD
jgi:ribonuclease P protein component